MTVEATCSVCGHTEEYELNEDESNALIDYWCYSSFGKRKPIQELFPNVPAWIRSGAIDKYSGGFCICPKCCEM